MFFYEGFICPVCGEKFHEADDIVVCPDCGAPHHRSCWLEVGHCHFIADHGTPQQWRRPEVSESPAPAPGPGYVTPPAPPEGYAAPPPAGRVCPQCGQNNLEFAEFCSRCGQALPPVDWRSNQTVTPPQASSGHGPFGGGPYGGAGRPYGEYVPVHAPVNDPFGGLPRDEKIDGATVDELSAFIGPNAAYYLPRFHKMAASGTHVSWNWSAFLLTPYWLFYRRKYVAGSLVMLYQIIWSFLYYFFSYLYFAPALEADTTLSILDLMALDKYKVYFIILFLLFVVRMIISVLFGMIGNSLYLRACLKRIAVLRESNKAASIADMNSLEAASYRRELGAAGGVSMALVAISAGVQWLSGTVITLLMLLITG